MGDDAKSFAAEVEAIDREIRRAHDARFRDWLLGLRLRLVQAAQVNPR